MTVSFKSSKGETLLLVEDAPFAPRAGELVFLHKRQLGLHEVVGVRHVLHGEKNPLWNTEVTLRRIIDHRCDQCAHWGPKCACNGSDDACEEFKTHYASPRKRKGVMASSIAAPDPHGP